MKALKKTKLQNQPAAVKVTMFFLFASKVERIAQMIHVKCKLLELLLPGN